MAMEGNKTAPAYIRQLNALRGFSALTVILFHLRELLIGGWHHRMAYDWPLFAKGFLAVDLFFLLSGFVLMHAYRETFQAGVKKAAYLDFIKNRLARIYPLHIGVLSVLVLLEPWTNIHKLVIDLHLPPFAPPGYDMPTLVSNLFLVQAWHIHPGTSWNLPSWSVSAEWFAYLLAPFLICGFSRWKGTLQPLTAYSVSSGLLLALDLSQGTMNILQDYGCLRMLFEFGMGLSLYNLYCRMSARPRYDALFLLAVGGIVAVMTWAPWRYWSDFLLIQLDALLILCCALSAGVVKRLLSSRLLFYFGEISFAAYMVHGGLLSAICFGLHRVLVPETPVGLTLLTAVELAAIWGASHLTHRYLEVPARRFLRERLSSRRERERVQSLP